MGNKKSKTRIEDLGNVLSTEYTDIIPYRNSLVSSYRLEEPIWVENSSYSVLKAYHLKTKRSLVLRKILINDTSKKELTNMLSISNKLSHTNIRQVEEVFQTKSHYYVTYQYFDGLNFTDYIISKNKNLNISQLKNFFRELLETLNFVHKSGVILRNFDPSNVLFDGQDLLLIGLSKARLFTTKNKKSKKSYQYIENYTSAFYKAPEVLDQNYDQRADIWVVGVMLHVVLSGSLPFATTKVEELIMKIKNSPVNIAYLGKKKVDPKAIELITGMLEKDPNKRLTIDQALENEWLKIQPIKLGRKESIEILKTIENVDKNFTIIDFLADFVAKRSYMTEEIKNLRRLFKQIDINRNGFITKDEMLYAIENIGLVIAEKDIDKIFDKYDKDKTNQLEFDEFVAVFIQQKSLTDSNKLGEFFEFIDEDQSGYIEYDELQNTLGPVLECVADKKVFNKFAGADRRLKKEEFVDFMLFVIENQNKIQEQEMKQNRRNSKASLETRTRKFS